MQPTKEQIASAARLVPQHLKESVQDGAAYWMKDRGRYWQPQAETVAGRSDWALLVCAIEEWVIDNLGSLESVNRDAADEVLQLYIAMREAIKKGPANMSEIQDTTFAAAVAIGEHIGAGK